MEEARRIREAHAASELSSEEAAEAIAKLRSERHYPDEGLAEGNR